MTEQAMTETEQTKTKIVIEEIDVELSEADLARMGEELAAALRQREATEVAAKKVAKEWRDKIETLDEDVARLRDAIHAKRERKEVRCEEIQNGQGGIDIIRCDNGQLLRQRKLTPREQTAREQAEREAAEREREARHGKLFAIEGGKGKDEADAAGSDGKHVEVERDPSGETAAAADGQPLVRARKRRKPKATTGEVEAAIDATEDAAAGEVDVDVEDVPAHVEEIGTPPAIEPGAVDDLPF